jgi:hypothetical protein
MSVTCCDQTLQNRKKQRFPAAYQGADKKIKKVFLKPQVLKHFLATASNDSLANNSRLLHFSAATTCQ